MNDLRAVLRDDVLLDRLAAGERPDDAGAAEDLLLALRADSLLAVPLAVPLAVHLAGSPEPAPAPAVAVPAVPAPRVLRVRSTLTGSLVAAAVLAGTCGVAAAVTGDPLAGLSGVREAVLVVAQPEGHTPLLRSAEGARLHDEVLRVADLLAAGRVEEASALLASMPSMLERLPADEQDLLRAELAGAAPDLVEAAGLVERDDRPGGGGSTGSASSPASGDDEHGRPGRTGEPGGSSGSASAPPPTSPGTLPVTAPPTAPPSAPPTAPPSTSPSGPGPSTPPVTSPTAPPTAPPPSGALAPAPPDSAPPPGSGRGTGSPTDPGSPTGTPNPPKTKALVEPSETAS